LNQRLFVGGDVSLNQRLFVSADVSMNQRLFVGGDASLNQRLFVSADVSMNQRLFVGGDVSLNQRLFVGRDVSLNQRLFVSADVSMNQRLFVGGDVSLNQRLFVSADVSMNQRLFVSADVSMNQNLFIRNDLTVQGRINVNNYTSNNIINNTVNNYTFIISEDLSLNGRLFVSADVSLNQRLFVGGDVSFNNRLYVAGKFDVGGSASLTTLAVTGATTLTGALTANGGISTSTISASDATTLSNKVKIYEASRTTYTATEGSLTIEHGNNGGISCIVFPSKVNLGGDYGYISYQDTATIGGAGETALLCIGTENDIGSDHLILQKGGGYVGIGTTTPTFILDVTGTLRATGQITGNSFNATSDQRIKTNINDINGKSALDTLRNINPVSYHFIDDSKQKSSIGFIAQQIQKSLENSVSNQTNYIPNIYENINIDGKTITLNEKFTSDISLCDYPVKLQFKDLSNNTFYGTIDKIIDSKTILLTKPLDTSLNNVFLYGQEVDDFLSINYDSVFTIVTGAVKQIDVELQETKQIVKDQALIIDELKSELEDLKSQISIFMKTINK